MMFWKKEIKEEMASNTTESRIVERCAGEFVIEKRQHMDNRWIPVDKYGKTIYSSMGWADPAVFDTIEKAVLFKETMGNYPRVIDCEQCNKIA